MRYETHPAAAIFPMMSDEELAELAADIAENGQKESVKIGDLDGREVLVDGRNRLAACVMAGVEPKIEKLNGEDQLAYIISKNVKRRHLNSGQRAMAVAMVYPEPAKAYKGKKSDDPAAKLFDMEKLSGKLLSMARTVLSDSLALGQEVMTGKKFLDAAYQEAKTRLDEKRSSESKMVELQKAAPDLATLVLESRITLDDALAQLETRKQDQAKLASIKDESPDLVELVEEGRMSVQDALAASDKRQEEDRNQRQATTALLAAVMRLFDARNTDPPKEAERLMRKFDPHLWPSSELGEPSSQLFQNAADVLTACARLRKGQEKRK